jgi:VWFA-related protein
LIAQPKRTLLMITESPLALPKPVRRRQQLWVLLTVLFLAPAASSQQNEQLHMSVNVKVVNVFATVRNKQGGIVQNLTKADFAVQEDGRPQTIRYFSQEIDLPLTLGLLVDTSLSQRRVLGQERSASETFLDEVLRENKDKAFVIHFDHQVELLQDVTSSRQLLQAALAGIEEPQMQRTRGDDTSGGDPGANPGGQGHRRGGQGGGTLLYDAVYLASKEVMTKQQGRKALIVLSDGVDRGSQETLATAIEAAQRADTLVYSILFTDDESYGGYGGPGRGGMGGMGRHGSWPGRYPQESRPDGKKILDQVCRETGGQLFEVSKKHSIDQIYDDIQNGLRNQYSLGYTPEGTIPGAGYHKITVATNEKGLTVHAREGYYRDQ